MNNKINMIIIGTLLILLAAPIVLAERQIDVKLEYSSGNFDVDNDGVESKSSAIDFTVSETKFNWEVDPTRLCTRWEIYSMEEKETTVVCNGADECCLFMGISSSMDNWDDELSLLYGRYGASYNNKVSAKVIYVDYSLDIEDPYADVYSSDWDYLYAVYLDENYFVGSSAKQLTSDEEYIELVHNLEKIKSNNGIDKVSLKDRSGSVVANGFDKKEDIDMEISEDGTIVSINNFNGSDASWDKIGNLEVKLDDTEIILKAGENGIIAKKSITVKNVNNFLSGDDYDGYVEIDASGIMFDTVLYCPDDSDCYSLSICGDLLEECYNYDSGIVKVYLPHFSSVVLGLNNNSVILDIIIPDNSSALDSGEGVILNFTVNVSVSANYSLDSGDYVGLGTGTIFSSILNGSLANGIIENGLHQLVINVKDSENYSSSVNYEFRVNDSEVPDLDVYYNSSSINNSVIYGNLALISVSLLTDEYSNVSYKLNNGAWTDILISGAINITLNPSNGSNILLLNASDVHGNRQVDNYLFTFIAPTCSDGILNQDETGVDCGGSCGTCVVFNVTLNQVDYNESDDVYTTIISRANSYVSLVMKRDGNVVYQSTVNPVFQGAPIAETRILSNTHVSGTYELNATMHYLGISEARIIGFNVLEETNPLSVSIIANNTTVNEGSTVAFSASVSGNVSGVAYSWDLDGNKAIDSTSPAPTKTYSNNGTYLVNLSVTDGHNTNSATQTITVRKVYEIIVIVKNESGQVVPDADVEFDSITKNTSSEGKAIFMLNPGDYRLRVDKDGYKRFSNDTTITQAETLNVVINHSFEDDSAPVVNLISPANNELVGSDITLRYSAQDEGVLICSLYLSFNDGWWSKEQSRANMNPNYEYSFSLNGTQPGNYEWKIECEDNLGNAAFSETWMFIVEGGVITEDIPEEDDKIAGTIDEINNIMSSISFSSNDAKNSADAIGLNQIFQNGIDELEKTQRDIYNLKWRRINDTELEVEQNKLYERVDNVRDSTPVNIEVMESTEFVAYPSKEDVLEVSEMFLDAQIKKYTKKDKKAYGDSNQELQKLITYTVVARRLRVEYLSGREGIVTLLEKKIDVKKDFSEEVVLEYIPKEIANSASEINFMFEDEIIVDDPLIKIDEEIEGILDVVYYINKDIDLDDIQNIKTVVVSNDLDIKQKGFLTGFAVFDTMGEKLVHSSSKRLVIEIIIIVILLIAYLAYSVGSIDLILNKLDILGMKKVQDIKTIIKNAEDHIKSGNYNDAKKEYLGAIPLFKELPKRLKKEVYALVTEFQHKINTLYINDLLAHARVKIDKGDIEGAYSIYDSISQIYKKIDKKYKKEVLAVCISLHKELIDKGGESE